MKIAIAAESANVARPTGVEHYARELIQGLSRVDLTNRYILYLRTPPRNWCSKLPLNFTVKYLPFPLGWTQIRLSVAMIMERPDALLIPSFSMPFLHPHNSVVTIHDLAWLRFPKTEKAAQRLSLMFTHTFARVAARRLIAVSDATKIDLVERLHVSQDRVRVIHHGFSAQDSTPSDSGSGPEVQLQDVEERVRRLGSPFIVCLGTLQPRKNLSRLIDAFVLMKQQGELPHSLVIAGREGWMCKELVAKIKATKHVSYFGYVDDHSALIKRADLLVQPSLYEGFGLSLLDAFAQGVPVACSNISSLPEVAGDAAEFFDPYSVESIAAAMTKTLKSPQRSEELRRLGYARLSCFSWDLCARKTLSVLQERPAKAWHPHVLATIAPKMPWSRHTKLLPHLQIGVSDALP